MSWLLPGALVMGAVLLVLTIRARRTDRERAALLLWGGSLVSHRPDDQPGPGDHPPVLRRRPGGAARRARRDRHHGPVGAPRRRGPAGSAWPPASPSRSCGAPCSSVAPRTGSPRCVPSSSVAGALGVVAILALPLLHKIPKLAIGLVAVLGLGAALAAPLFSTVATAATPHNGAIPSVTPTPAGGQGGPGGGGGFPRRLPRWRTRATCLRRRRVPRWRLPRRRHRRRTGTVRPGPEPLPRVASPAGCALVRRRRGSALLRRSVVRAVEAAGSWAPASRTLR